MDIVTLGAALNGSAEYVNSHFKGGSNIQIVDNPDGTQTINASGEVSSEDTVARAEIAEMKDGTTLDSFGDVETALATKADSSVTYTKTEVDTALSVKANSADVYSKTAVDTALSNKADKSTTYTKTEVDASLGNKADKSTTYTKTEVDTALSGKQNAIDDLSTIRSGAALGATAVQPEAGKGLSTNDYTTAEKTKLAGIAEGAEVNVQSNWTQTTTTADDYIKNKPTLGTAAAKNATDAYNATGTDVTTGKAVAAALATLPEPMVFKGSLGTGGTITSLPTASSSNKGYVYKVITAGTYASQSAKVGDTFISDGSAWVLIPSGDEPSGTVTNVAVANGGGLTVSGSPITSSGTITVGHSNSVTAKTSSSVKKFTYDAHGHVTGSSELSTAESDALASGIDSTKVEQIETNKNNILLKANTSDVNTATTNLQAQIDNIVSGSTADSEVINARVGANGTSYNTLKARLDGEITEVQGDIEEIQETLYKGQNAAFTDNYYITTSGSEVTLNSYGYPDGTYNAAWETFYCGCRAGMKYILTGAGGSNPRLWAFANSDWEIISVSEASARATNQVIIAPENAEYIIINNDKRIVRSASLVAVEDTYEDIKQLAASISGTLLELIDNKNIASSGTEILVDENNVPITTSSTNYVCYYGECTGKHYKITGYGGFTPRLFAFADENWEILNNAYAYQIAENLIITPPSNAKYVIFNFNKTHDYLAEVIGEVTKIRILSYNVGDFAGTGYTTGSDDLAIEYRRSVAASNPQIVFAQEDVAYYNQQQQTLSRDEVFGMFNFYIRTGNTDFNYKSFASDFVINNVAQVNYQTTGLSHTYFLTGDLTINGKTIKLVNVHLDWADVTRRGHQIDEVIAYCNNYPYVIIAGDMNPSVRVNGEFPEGSSHEDNFFRYADYTKWTDEGYKIANAGYFGAFCTDLTYPTPTGKKWSTDKSDFACWDNVIVSGNINIKNVGIVTADYMNDHAPIWADLEIGI